MAHDDELCTRITRQIAEYEGEADTPDLPLYEVIDTDALERLFQPAESGSGDGGGVVSFTYCGYTVAVDSAGRVDVVPQGSSSAPSRQLAQKVTH